ncbi:MAG TPA: AI-2E family transporter [Anaerolineales bacterium]|nr:AI-2E family transporter [Anaerolineales bacterium]
MLEQPESPKWNTPTKFLVALATLAVIGGLVVYFNNLIGPVLACFILTYLLSPLVGWFAKRIGSWGAAVGLTYGLLVVIMVGVVAGAGFAIERQIEGLIIFLIDISRDLPGALVAAFNATYEIAGFTFTLRDSNLLPIAQQILSAIQPVLGQTGAFATNFASGTASAVAWLAFVLLVSFYIMIDFPRILPSLERALPPGYGSDVRRLARDLGPIWNAYLRGQVTLALVIGVMVSVGMTAAGVQFGPALGIVSFLLEFIPYIGPTLAALTGVLIAFFQGGNIYGLNQLTYAIVILVLYIVLQQIQGNVFYPRIMGQNLGLHPATILVGALLMAQLLGFVGILLAAPLLATVGLFGGYIYAKLFDLDPFPEKPPPPPPATRRGLTVPAQLRALFERRRAIPPPPPREPDGS